MVMRAVEWAGVENLRQVDHPVPVPASGQAVVEVAAAGICGSDLHSYLHGVAVVPGQVLGHEFSGRVVDVCDVPGLSVGDRVVVRPLQPCGACSACRESEPQRCEDTESIGYEVPGAFADHVLVTRAVVGSTVFVLPHRVSDQAGALVEPLAVAAHAVSRSDVGPDDTVVVLGAGTIGLGVVALLRRAGVARIVVSEPSSLRRERAATLGATRAIDPTKESLTDAVRDAHGQAPGEARAAVVFECAGSPQALDSGLRALRRGGRMVLVAAYGREVPIFPDRIMVKEVSVIGSIAYRHEFAEIVGLFAEGVLDAADFVSHTYPLDDIDQAFRMQTDSRRAIKVLVEPARDSR
jgi:2-desacetyl-2-hydroxyethyl bacteriochlorophyllide A dehydrogenase